MTENENWKMRGIYSQMVSVQGQIVEIFASDKLTDNRMRDLKRALAHIAEQLEHISE